MSVYTLESDSCFRTWKSVLLSVVTTAETQLLKLQESRGPLVWAVWERPLPILGISKRICNTCECEKLV